MIKSKELKKAILHYKLIGHSQNYYLLRWI